MGTDQSIVDQPLEITAGETGNDNGGARELLWMRN
jgi:hypothetical protein